MVSRRWIGIAFGAGLSAAVLHGMRPLPAQADDPSETIGKLVRVVRNVYGTPQGGTEQPQFGGDPVFYGEKISTLADSAALIRFNDGTEVTLGENAILSLDRFVFDTNTKNGNALVSLTKGALRIVGNLLPQTKFTVQTPTATIGIRHQTTVVAAVGLDGNTDVDVADGDADIAARGAPDKVSITTGHSVSVAAGSVNPAAPGLAVHIVDPVVGNGFVGTRSSGDGASASASGDAAGEGSTADRTASMGGVHVGRQTRPGS